jgi:hypothetical protein
MRGVGSAPPRADGDRQPEEDPMRNRVAAATVAVVMTSLAPLVGGSAALAGTDDGTPGIAVTTPSPPGFTSYGGVRFQAMGADTSGDEYLGVADLGIGADRIESNFADGSFSLNGNPGSRSEGCEGSYNVGPPGVPRSNSVILTWNRSADTLTSTLITSTLSCTMVFGPGFAQELANARGISSAQALALLGDVNALQVVIDDREVGNTIDLTGVSVDRSNVLGPFMGQPGGQRSWLATGYDFDAPNGFTIAGNLRLAGSFGSCDETCRLEIRFGSFAIPSDDEGPITSDVVATPNLVRVGDPITVMAAVDDSTTGGSSVGSAEYTLDDGATWAPVSASDGVFDEVEEEVTVDLTAPSGPGAYDLCVRGSDVIPNVGDPACVTIIVVDPSGGFVTGGGWIASPEGAYTADPGLVGRVHVGFVSKYGEGASVPRGSVELRFRAADLNFHSSVQEWLIVDVAGGTARFTGTGTVNGLGTYGFTIWVTDGRPDAIRIRILEAVTGTIVYDNGIEQAVGGGSLVVHAR